MRLLLGVFFLSCVLLPADTFGPIPGSIDGVSYKWYWSPTNTDTLIWADFSQPINSYSLVLTGPPSTASVRPGYGQATFVYAGGQGSWNITGANFPSLVELAIDVNASYFTPGLTFSKVSGPPADAPEPVTAALTVLGLFALIPARRWLTIM